MELKVELQRSEGEKTEKFTPSSENTPSLVSQLVIFATNHNAYSFKAYRFKAYRDNQCIAVMDIGTTN